MLCHLHHKGHPFHYCLTWLPSPQLLCSLPLLSTVPWFSLLCRTSAITHHHIVWFLDSETKKSIRNFHICLTPLIPIQGVEMTGNARLVILVVPKALLLWKRGFFIHFSIFLVYHERQVKRTRMERWVALPWEPHIPRKWEWSKKGFYLKLINNSFLLNSLQIIIISSMIHTVCMYRLNSVKMAVVYVWIPPRSQLQGASLRGLLVLAALGLVLGDAVLTNAALAELTPHQHHKEHLHHIAFLRAAEATTKVHSKQ